MELTKCPECGTEASDEARLCPKCGHHLRKKITKTTSIDTPVLYLAVAALLIAASLLALRFCA